MFHNNCLKVFFFCVTCLLPLNYICLRDIVDLRVFKVERRGEEEEGEKKKLFTNNIIISTHRHFWRAKRRVLRLKEKHARRQRSHSMTQGFKIVVRQSCAFVKRENKNDWWLLLLHSLAYLLARLLRWRCLLSASIMFFFLSAPTLTDFKIVR